MNSNENEWLQCAQQGDDEAFANLVELYQNPVYNLCYRMTGNAQEAEDAAQETFWRAYQAIRRYDANRSFITWLLSIAAHYCIDQHRKRRLPTFALELLPDEDVPFVSVGPEGAAIQSEDEQCLHRMLAELKPQDRGAVILRYWYDFSEQEISEALAITVSAVKSRLHRARQALAQQWTAQQTHPLITEAI